MAPQVGENIKNCQNCKKYFSILPEDNSFYEKIKVPPPTWCPRCRFIRRAIFRNEHYLFKKEDDKTGKEIFSAYPKNSAIKIYDRDFWWSDAWDPMTYGFSYDFSSNFFEQFRKLQTTVPWPALSASNTIQSDYCNNVSDLKNSYMAFSGVSGENLLYGVGINNIKDCIDFYHTKDSSFCYEVFSVIDSNQVFFSTECAECRDVWFSVNCRNCSDCFGCVNLNNKKYHIFNQPFTPEEYKKKISGFNTGSYSGLLEIKRKAQEFQSNFPLKFMHTMKSPDCSGDNIYGSKNVKNSFHVYKSENLKYCQNVYDTKDSYDYTISGWGSELMYECTTGGGSSGLKFCFDCWPTSNNLEYCMECYSCSDCFGCVGLKKKQYCIFNTQYTKEEYLILREKIINHMNQKPYVDTRGRIYTYGEFFPLEFSPFAYNGSFAFDYLPLSKKDTISSGYQWNDFLKKGYEVDLLPENLPDSVLDTTEEILNKSIGCAHADAECECNCTAAFRVIGEEFKFYKRFNIPIPRLCINCRFAERIKQLNSIDTYQRACECGGSDSLNGLYKNTVSHFHGADRCPVKFETSYSPETSKIIYCEKCYQNEVF